MQRALGKKQKTTRRQSSTLDAPRWHRATIQWAIALVAITFIAYWPTLFAGFIWDDPEHILNNQTLRSFAGLREMWTSRTSLPQWYPFTHTTFWIEYHLWGAWPPGYHFTNILLHAISCVLLWRLLVRLRIPGALFAAVMFATHPVLVESVAWATERKNTLSLLFYLLAANLWLSSPSPLYSGERVGIRGLSPRSKEETPLTLAHSPAYGGDGTKGIVSYLLTLVLFICALLSKSVTASWPAAMLLILWWQRGRLRLRDMIPLVPFFAIGLLASFNTSWLERTHVGATNEIVAELNFSSLQRVIIAGRDIWFYASKLIWPHNLTFIYPRWDSIDAKHLWNLIFAAMVIVVIVSLFALRKRIGRGPLTAVLFFCGTLVPALGFVNVYPMRFSFVADHFQYHASIGLIVLFAAVTTSLARSRVAAKPIAFTLIALLAALTFNRARDYESAETIWTDALAKNDRSWLVYTRLGVALHDRERDDLAGPYFLKALELAPGWWETHLNAAGVFRDRGDIDRAIFELRETTRLWPPYTAGPANIAKLELKRQRFDAAIAAYRSAILANPDDPQVRVDLGKLLLELKRLDEALKVFDELAHRIPNQPAGWQYLGDAQLRAGKRLEAIQSFRNALQADPKFPPARDALRSLGEMP